jgi:hypothetical protein
VSSPIKLELICDSGVIAPDVRFPESMPFAALGERVPALSPLPSIQSRRRCRFILRIRILSHQRSNVTEGNHVFGLPLPPYPGILVVLDHLMLR